MFRSIYGYFGSDNDTSRTSPAESTDENPDIPVKTTFTNHLETYTKDNLLSNPVPLLDTDEYILTAENVSVPGVSTKLEIHTPQPNLDDGNQDEESVGLQSSVPKMTLSDFKTGTNTALQVPMFPSLDGPQRLVAASTKTRPRQKVALEPGHSALDWARLKSSGKDLRGVNQIGRYTLEDLKKHRKKDDAWTALGGKVYNITPYLKFHPGGEKELMRVAGRDGTKLFMLTHAWINADMMLDQCLVGFLVRGSDEEEEE